LIVAVTAPLYHQILLLGGDADDGLAVRCATDAAGTAASGVYVSCGAARTSGDGDEHRREGGAQGAFEAVDPASGPGLSQRFVTQRR
jgi:hypothetical protein